MMMHSETQEASLSEESLNRLTRRIMVRCREHLSTMSPVSPTYERIGLELITNLPVGDPRSESYPQFLQQHGIYGLVCERYAFGASGELVPEYYALYGPRDVREFLEEHRTELDAFTKSRVPRA